MTKKYKVDKSKIIGNVIFVVEGGRPETGGTELRLLKRIFSDVLGYEVQEWRRGTEEFIGYGNNKSSRVFALNLPKNQFLGLEENKAYLEHELIDNLQKFLLELGKGFCFVARQRRIAILLWL